MPCVEINGDRQIHPLTYGRCLGQTMPEFRTTYKAYIDALRKNETKKAIALASQLVADQANYKALPQIARTKIQKTLERIKEKELAPPKWKINYPGSKSKAEAQLMSNFNANPRTTINNLINQFKAIGPAKKKEWLTKHGRFFRRNKKQLGNIEKKLNRLSSAGLIFFPKLWAKYAKPANKLLMTKFTDRWAKQSIKVNEALKGKKAKKTHRDKVVNSLKKNLKPEDLDVLEAGLKEKFFKTFFPEEAAQAAAIAIDQATAKMKAQGAARTMGLIILGVIGIAGFAAVLKKQRKAGEKVTVVK